MFNNTGSKISVDIIDHGSPASHSIGGGKVPNDGEVISPSALQWTTAFVNGCAGRVRIYTHYGCNVGDVVLGNDGPAFLQDLASRANMAALGYKGSVGPVYGFGGAINFWYASHAGEIVTKTP